MSRASLNLLGVPLSYAVRTYAMKRWELFDLLDEWERGPGAKAARYVVAMAEGLAKGARGDQTERRRQKP